MIGWVALQAGSCLCVFLPVHTGTCTCPKGDRNVHFIGDLDVDARAVVLDHFIVVEQCATNLVSLYFGNPVINIIPYVA